MTTPRFGFHSLLDVYGDGVIGSSQQGDNLVANAYDWRPQSFWSPERTGNAVGNGDFLLFTAGPSAAPDGFDLVGAGATVAQTTPSDPITLPNTVTVTRVGADANLGQDISDGSPEELVGITVGAAAYLRTSVAAQGSVTIDDGVTQTTSPFHTGGGAWERLEVTAVIGTGATQVRVQIDVVGSDGPVEADAFVAISLEYGSTTIPEYDEVGEAALTVFPAEGQLLRNWVIDLWTAGGEILPDRFEAFLGTPTSVLRTEDSQVGRYAMEITGASIAVGQEVVGDELEDLRGKTAWMGCWCKTSTAARARAAFLFRFPGGTLSAEVSGTPGGGGRIHTGGGTYEWLSTSVDVPFNATGVIPVGIQDGAGGDFAATWDGFYLVRADAEPAQAPQAQDVDYLTMTAHNLGTAGVQAILEGSDDNFASVTTVLTLAPSNDLTKWVDLEPIADGGPGPSSFDAYRVRLSPTAPGGACPAEIGMVAFGKYLQLPCPPLVPFEVLDEGFESEIPKTRAGAPLGRSIPRLTKRFNMRFQILYRDFVVDELYGKWWKHAGGTKGLPWFLQWNDGDYPEETFFVFLPDNERFTPRLFSGQQVREFEIQIEGLPG